MTGIYENKFCGSIYRLYYQDVRLIDKEGKPTKKTNKVMHCQRIKSSVNPEPGDPFTPDVKVWENHIKFGRMIKISDD